MIVILDRKTLESALVNMPFARDSQIASIVLHSQHASHLFDVSDCKTDRKAKVVKARVRKFAKLTDVPKA